MYFICYSLIILLTHCATDFVYFSGSYSDLFLFFVFKFRRYIVLYCQYCCKYCCKYCCIFTVSSFCKSVPRIKSRFEMYLYLNKLVFVTTSIALLWVSMADNHPTLMSASTLIAPRVPSINSWSQFMIILYSIEGKTSRDISVSKLPTLHLKVSFM